MDEQQYEQLQESGLVSTTDAFSNPMARLGFGTQNLLESTIYPMLRISENYMLLNSLYRGNWVVQNIISTVPEDATKKWFNITSSIEPAKIEEMEKAQRKMMLRQRVVEGMKWGRLYGGALGIILIKGHDNIMDQELDLDQIMVGSFKGLMIVDRWSGVYPEIELVTDLSDPDRGLPKYYVIRDVTGQISQRVHHSRVVRFIGRDLPYWEQVTSLYWGESEIEAIYSEIVKRDNISNNIASLTFKANVTVMETDNVDQLFGVGGGQAQMRFWQMVQAMSVAESNFSTRVVNKGDNVHRDQYNFAGLSDVYELALMDLSGAARIPMTKLFSRTPTGLNATGESDLRNYYDYLEEVRESQFRPIIEKLLPILALSTLGEIPNDLDFSFDSLRTPDELEKADIIQRKVIALTTAYQNDGITQESYSKELKALGEQSGMFSSITDEMIESGKDVWFSKSQEMRDPMAGLTYGDYEEPDNSLGETEEVNNE